MKWIVTGLCVLVAGVYLTFAVYGAFSLSAEKAGDGLNVIVSAPAGFTDRVELYACSNLVSRDWRVAGQNLRPTDGCPAKLYTLAGDTGFFVAGNMDVDSDQDGLPDDRELMVYKTNPNKWDTDGDGLNDGFEVQNNLNPLSLSGPSEANIDTDGDGLPDTLEYLFFSNLAQTATDDFDGDGLLNGEELELTFSYAEPVAVQSPWVVGLTGATEISWRSDTNVVVVPNDGSSAESVG